MSELGVAVLAIAVWLGALVAVPVPRWLGLALVAGALVWRRPAVLVVGGFVLAAGLGAAAWRGLTPPPSGTVRAAAVLVTDPRPVAHGLRVDVRIGGRRFEAWARGAPAAALRPRLAGEVVALRGRLRPLPPLVAGRLAFRHVAGRIEVDHVGVTRAGAPVARAANRVRRVLVDGAAPLSPTRRTLLTGLLIGDDRNLPPVIASDFRAAGMTHLLVVSGQNVAFVLAVAGPVLRRLQLRGRFVVSLALIAFFAVMTRAEPSVLRASGMAALSCWAAFAGRPISRVRVLCLAVAALVLIDPLLTRSIGFQLSVGASAGLVLLARPIAARLPGPRWLAEPLAVTIAAQAGVAPVLTTTFGGLPLVAVGANLLAVPVAGVLTAWGMTAGLAAGLLGPPFDGLLHAPTGVLVGWIESVARVAAGVPLGLVGTGELVAALAASLVVRALRVRRAVLAGALVLLVAARLPAGPVAGEEIAHDARVWRDGGVVLVVGGGADGGRVLEGLRRVGIRRVDLVVARTGGRTVAGIIADVRTRLHVGAVAAPVGNRIRNATAVAEPLTVDVGHLRVGLRPSQHALEVDVGCARCSSTSATGATTSPAGRSSWASSTGRPTRSTTAARTGISRRSFAWPRLTSQPAPTSSTWAG